MCHVHPPLRPPRYPAPAAPGGSDALPKEVPSWPLRVLSLCLHRYFWFRLDFFVASSSPLYPLYVISKGKIMPNFSPLKKKCHLLHIPRDLDHLKVWTLGCVLVFPPTSFQDFQAFCWESITKAALFALGKATTIGSN